MKKSFLLIIIFFGVQIYAQVESKKLNLKTFTVKNDSIQIDSVSINSADFKVFDKNNIEIDSSKYSIDFSKSLLIFKDDVGEEVNVQYTPYPEFLTKRYFRFDKKLIMPKEGKNRFRYSLNSKKNRSLFVPFEGLETDGNITRGFTIGNNQNAVANSTLDLQISGKLSSNITLKASIVDTNIPIQENGNTYKLNEFDRVFIELISENWNINAGDIYLNNNETTFLQFNKKVSGLEVNAKIKKKNWEINTKASGAFVKGKYKKYEFPGQEGNQGPYKISDFDPNNYVLILSGTEQIYVNGQLLKRGENYDYIINYNTSEVIFTTTFPINANMRISAEYQYTDRVYNRFTTYEKVSFKNKKLDISGFFYNENDVKNQSLEPELTDEQKQILANAGDDPAAMVSPSAYEDDYSDSKVLYKKSIDNGVEYFEYTSEEQDNLFYVNFTFVGENLGDYSLKEVIAIGKIYEYVGGNLGSYSPVTQLVSPEKLQVAVLKANYVPSEKTNIKTEVAFSNSDINLFSDIDDENNTGLATKFDWTQQIYKKEWLLKSNVKYDYINENFKTIQRIQKVEFNRDWNVESSTIGNQQLINAGLNLSKNDNFFDYQFSTLEFGENYKGNIHQIAGASNSKKVSLNFNASMLNNESETEKGSFLRYLLNAQYIFSKAWIGAKLSGEKNELNDLESDNLNPLSHKYIDYEAFVGVGDTAKVFVKVGANFRTTDSIQNNQFERANNSKIYYLNSQLINSKTATLSMYLNYRTVDNTNFDNEESLNSKIVFRKQFWNQFLTWATTYQTRSGTIPLQDYTYKEVDPEHGYYMWIDYNGNGIKELNEFEVAQFADQARYLRVVLPTVNYIGTHQNIFSQNIILNPIQWSTKNNLRKVLSHFYNQSSFIIDSKLKKEESNFNFNPFETKNDDLLALIFNIRNNFYLNRGKKNYSTTYQYLKNQNRNITTIDEIENNVESHKILFEHKIGKFWQVNLDLKKSNSSTNSINYENRNYKLLNQSIFPKLSYYYSETSFFSLFYKYTKKENEINNLETLSASKLGASINYSKDEKSLIRAEFNMHNFDFVGNQNSPVAYQMLEGLQPGKNYTWNLLLHKKLMSFLSLNINYLGRKSETSNTIHTGSIQLRADF